VNGYSGAFQNYYNSAADYGPAGYDVTHNISGTGVYDLPFGNGRLFLNHMNRVLDEAIGGWKISTAAVVYSGSRNRSSPPAITPTAMAIRDPTNTVRCTLKIAALLTG